MEQTHNDEPHLSGPDARPATGRDEENMVDQQGDRDVLVRVQGIVSRVLGQPREDVGEQDTLRDDLEIDSTGILEIVLAIESEFRVSIPDDEVGRFSDMRVVEVAQWVQERSGPVAPV